MHKIMKHEDTQNFCRMPAHTNTHWLCNSYNIKRLCVFPHIAFVCFVWIWQWIPSVSLPYITNKSLQ